MDFQIASSYFEFYIDHITDLYEKMTWAASNADASNPHRESTRIEAKLDQHKRVVFKNAIEIPTSLEKQLELYQGGSAQRTLAATNLNPTSSRSFVFFVLKLHFTDKSSVRTTESKITFVDSAGWERSDKSAASIERLKWVPSVRLVSCLDTFVILL